MTKQLFIGALVSTLLVAITSSASISNLQPEFSLSYRYKSADLTTDETGVEHVLLNRFSNSVSSSIIDKTILVARLGDTVKDSLISFQNACTYSEEPELGHPTAQASQASSPIFTPLPLPFPKTLPEPPGCESTREDVANDLLNKIAQITQEIDQSPSISADEEIYQTLDLLRKLAANMKDYKGTGSPLESGVFKTAIMGGASLGVSTGGAQDFGYIKKLINDGFVPMENEFVVKGFMAEFDLTPKKTDCDQVLCIFPEYKFDALKNKLFVQVAMSTAVTEQTFERKPLNLSLVIDISGSMGATDSTEKSRLEWAKVAAKKTVAELGADDYLSVVVFDAESEILVPTVQLSSDDIAAQVIAAIESLQTKGSTNLYDGLKDAYELVSDAAVELNGYENRVILISDAGLNTGVVAESTTLALVTDYAAEQIGLTAIGLGLNFNQDFVLGISKSHGGNYIFAHSGQDMFRYFKSFNYLVSPIAHQLKARITFKNTEASFVKSYGIPMTKDQVNDDFINVQSLFLTNQGGGAILLEYDLK